VFFSYAWRVAFSVGLNPKEIDLFVARRRNDHRKVRFELTQCHNIGNTNLQNTRVEAAKEE
jgi:hypothetical protein